MADLGRPFRANYMVRGSPPERVFAALLDVRRFPSEPSAFAAPALDDAGPETRVRPGARLELP